MGWSGLDVCASLVIHFAADAASAMAWRRFINSRPVGLVPMLVDDDEVSPAAAARIKSSEGDLHA